MIEFASPPIALTITQYMELVELWEKSSSCVGFANSLGDKFFLEGVNTVHTEIIPKLSMLAGPGVIPRVLPLYSILYWFSLQVSNRVLLHVTCCSTLLLTTFIAAE